jgi:LPXTG-site transpeptidase (sortase) family protein
MLTAGARGTVERMSTAAEALPAHRRFDWRTPVRWFGLLCLMGAAFFAGYVVWLLYGTGLETKRAQADLRSGIEQQLEHPQPASQAPGPGRRVIPGSAYAVIQIPSIGIDFVVVQGTDYTSLKKGPGHYIDTADPRDDTGRVGIAGHRTTYLHPFFNLDRVQTGDTIRLLTPYGGDVYSVTRVFVVPEEGSGVVLEQTSDPTLVLTTCNPKYASSQRLIVEADRVGGPAT